jgi:hypothetical protein
MGSFSVHCQISKITVRDGEEALILPIHKAECYSDYFPACFPIRGTYNDYGTLEKIQKDFNTEFLEEYYQKPIEQILDAFTTQREETIDKDIEIFWMSGKVYDWMKDYHPEGFHRAGSFDFGDPVLLENLGFSFVGDNKNDERFKKIYGYKNKRFVATDGTWCKICTKTGKKVGKSYRPIYYLRDVTKYLPEIDTSFLQGKEQQNIYNYCGKRFSLALVRAFMGNRYSSALYWDENEELNYKILCSNIFTEVELEEMKKKTLPKMFYWKFLRNPTEEVFSRCADLITIHKNMQCYSNFFHPYPLYHTPQCGEFEIHQVILEKFAEINKGFISEGDDW